MPDIVEISLDTSMKVGVQLGFGKLCCAGSVSITHTLRSDINTLLLQAIDRPLFKDFWERFRECLTLLRDKHQRTVYRHAFSTTTWHPFLGHAT